MKIIRIFLLLVLGGIVMGACEEVISPDLTSVEPVVVVDGWVIDEPNESRVVLSRTAPFNVQEPNPRISDALVRVIGGGNTFIFPEDPREQGVYRPLNNDFKAEPTVEYTLQTTVDGIDYEGVIRPRPVPVIDSITTEFKRFPSEPERTGQYITFYFNDPPSTPNFYFWEVFVNGALISGSDINITDDVTFDGNLAVPLELTDYRFTFRQEVEVRLHSLTEEAYNYYQALKLLLDSGVPSQSTPDNPITNIFDVSTDEETDKKIALGYFNATITSSRDILIP